MENERASEPWWHRLRLVELVEYQWYVDGGNAAFFPCPSKILRRDQVRSSQGGGAKANAREDFIGQASALSSKLAQAAQSTEVPPHASSWQPFKSKRANTSLDQQYYLLLRVVPESFL